jgi:hypothetical protein
MAIDIKLLTKFDEAGIKKASGSLKDFGKKAAIGIGVGVGAAVALGTQLISAGEEASTSNARINQIADSMGLFTKEITGVDDGAAKVTTRLVDLANATARATGIDQNAIKATQAKLLTFAELGQSADEAGSQFDRATMAALDLASAGFGTAEGNAVQLGKALNDPIKGLASLSKSGVTFTDDQKAMIEAMVEGGNVMGAQEMVLKAIETQVGGTSVATANGSDRMKIAFSQLMEFVGLKLLPVFERFVGFVVDKVVPVIQRMAEVAIPFLSEQFQKLRERLEPIIEQIGAFLAPIIEKVVDFVRKNTGTVKAFFAVLAGAAVLAMIAALVGAIVSLFSPVVLIIGGIALLVAAFKHAYDTSETFRDVIAAAFDTVKVLIGIAMDAIRPIIQGLADTFEGVVRLVKGLVNGDFKEVVGGLKDIFLGMISTVIAQFLAMPRMMLGALRTGLSKIGTSLANFGRDLVSKIVGGITSAAGSIGSAILGAIPGGGAIGGLIGGVKNILPFAAGGIVTGPTLGLVGEAGPEAIIPLSQLGNVMGGGGVTVNVQGSVISEADLIERIRRGLVESQRGGRQLVA